MEPTASAQPIRFLLNDQVIEVNDVAPATSILSFLRQRTGRTGTKEGCAEGDCGACTVVTGEFKGGQFELRAINACIQFLPTLDGKALFTVEHLRQKGGRLHPVQASMVENHASQCGYCTPGFVMSLWALYVNRQDKDDANFAVESAVRLAITGNLCRCTGYRPIIDAGTRMFELPEVRFEREVVSKTLKAITRGITLDYQFAGQRFLAPQTLAELTALRKTYPSSTILAGGTDVGIWVNKAFRDLDVILYTGKVSELQSISADAHQIKVGAAVSLSDAFEAICGYFPQMREIWERFASVPIRNAGTLGGNIANGSPIGDTMPALIALGAEVVLGSQSGNRQLPLEDFYIAYQKKAMRPDELLAYVHIPKAIPALRFRTYKLSKRFDSDISAVCAAFAIELTGQEISRCRIAYGGMSATPKRATHTETALIGRAWNEETAKSAMTVVARDFAPLADLRASAGYRLTAAQNLLYRFFLETRPVNPMGADQVSVFAQAL